MQSIKSNTWVTRTLRKDFTFKRPSAIFSGEILILENSIEAVDERLQNGAT